MWKRQTARRNRPRRLPLCWSCSPTATISRAGVQPLRHFCVNRHQGSAQRFHLSDRILSTFRGRSLQVPVAVICIGLPGAAGPLMVLQLIPDHVHI